jgi:hypothetical protein
MLGISMTKGTRRGALDQVMALYAGKNWVNDRGITLNCLKFDPVPVGTGQRL